MASLGLNVVEAFALAAPEETDEWKPAQPAQNLVPDGQRKCRTRRGSSRTTVSYIEVDESNACEEEELEEQETVEEVLEEQETVEEVVEDQEEEEEENKADEREQEEHETEEKQEAESGSEQEVESEQDEQGEIIDHRTVDGQVAWKVTWKPSWATKAIKEHYSKLICKVQVEKQDVNGKVEYLIEWQSKWVTTRDAEHYMIKSYAGEITAVLDACIDTRVPTEDSEIWLCVWTKLTRPVWTPKWYAAQYGVEWSGDAAVSYKHKGKGTKKPQWNTRLGQRK